MIHADVHEPERIIEVIKAKTDVIVENITPGDYVFPPIGIERKTYPDFLQSIKTRRLFEQLKRLKQCYSQAYLIIEAPYLMNVFNTSPSYAVPTYRIILYLLDRDIRVLFTSSPEHTAEIILLIYKRASRTYPALISLPARHKPKMRTLQEEQIFFLQGIPGMGKKTVKKIIMAFPTIEQFLKAKPSDLTGILGRKKRRRLKQLLSTKFN